MEAKVIKNKFSIFLIDDYLTMEEELLLWKELDFINFTLFENLNTGAKDVNTFLKQGGGTWIRAFYNPLNVYQYCKYFKFYKKFLSNNLLVKQFIEEDFYFNTLLYCNHDDSVINYYGHGDYYLQHKDTCLFSMIYLTCKDESNILKGDLYFKENNTTITFKKNRLIIFPSFAVHEVLPVELRDNISGMGRYSITTFFTNYSNLNETHENFTYGL